MRVRIFASIARAGSETPARYSSTVFGTLFSNFMGDASTGFFFLMGTILQRPTQQVHDRFPCKLFAEWGEFAAVNPGGARSLEALVRA